MNRISTLFLFSILSVLYLASCNSTKKYDVAMVDVQLFNSKTKVVEKHKTVLIQDDTIAAIIDANEKTNAIKVIEGKNRLLTPGFIDTHIHFTDVYGDYKEAPEYLPKDSLNEYRQQLAETYLAYGTTTIRVAGQPEKWIEPTLGWQNTPSPQFPDVYISGGALISNEDRNPYINHTEVKSPEAAAEKVQEYYDLGIRHIKLYWRLRYPELKAALDKANALGMTVCGHIDQNVAKIDSTLDLGLTHYEHAFAPIMSVMDYNENWPEYLEYIATKTTVDQSLSDFFVFILEVFAFVNQHPQLKPKLNALIDKMAKNNATICSTTHLFAEKAELSYFSSKSYANDSTLFPQKSDFERYKSSFKILMKVTKQMHDAGVKLNIGTDCKEGGKAALSEMMLFYEAGFSIEDILQIATLNGAIAIDLDDKYGSIELGKKANLVLFEKNPFDDYKNFLSKKTILKDGKLYQNEIKATINN